MDIFSSQWLINMLAKSSKTPQGRILSLFDILEDWLNAPNIHLEVTHEDHANQGLIAFFTEQAKACKTTNPSMLAEHIVLIARNATQQAIDHQNTASFAHAKKAANALILAQTQKDRTLSKPAIYSIAASLFLLVGAGTLWLPQLLQTYQQSFNLADTAAHNTTPEAVVVTTFIADNSLTANDAAKMYAKYEQMRNGTCQFPEALQIPDKDKAIYLENVVGGKLPTDLKDLAVANFYLEKVRCNFTPMLMANSK
jgi:hypothetical protein